MRSNVLCLLRKVISSAYISFENESANNSWLFTENRYTGPGRITVRDTWDFAQMNFSRLDKVRYEFHNDKSSVS